MALLALGEFGGDEFGGAALHDFLGEARRQFVVELDVAVEVPRFKERGTDRHVGLALPNRFIDRARGVADFQSHVPQAIEQGLGDGFAPRRLFVGKEKQQIDVGARRQQPAAVAAGRDHRHAFGLGRHPCRIELAAGKFEQDADDLVLQQRQPLGAAAAMPVFA